jgi:hypothetical protein
LCLELCNRSCDGFGWQHQLEVAAIAPDRILRKLISGIFSRMDLSSA